MQRNPCFKQYSHDYLFVEIGKRVQAFEQTHPDANLISLGVGDTTEPLPSSIVDEIVKKARELGTREGYRGYPSSVGDRELREKIAECIYCNTISPDEIFISDGAKCDIGRFQWLFGKKTTMTVQDPSYPVYTATHFLSGKKKVYTLSCCPKNNFFPKIENFPRTDLIYLCSPNNPTGTVLTHDQLERIVTIAKRTKAFILFDAAYAAYIRDPALPQTIYEISGAKEVAIEVGSFSKLAGFSGVRLGWTVIPKTVCFDEGTWVGKDWTTIVTTFFNGVSHLSKAGGLAALTDEGRRATRAICDSYLANAALLRKTMEAIGYKCYGGVNAPYLWVDLNGGSSWEIFDNFLRRAHLITTPGVGFGKGGEGYLRLSAFGEKERILEASCRLQSVCSLRNS
ncbi:MAG: LL-diaminopimelate aminotransferase [Chlamydiia bacterium]|nr:LL-diaminopimelate aminotransferase [Chlamydiia bacterium]